MNRLWDWIKNQIVQEVPEYLAACEFDCRCVSECLKNQCTSGERETRERRPHGDVRYIVVPTPHTSSRGWRAGSVPREAAASPGPGKPENYRPTICIEPPVDAGFCHAALRVSGIRHS